ncbi:MAG TPA: histidine kinase [Jatrophihabitantaceae bacterium]|nr:histidine kinase [Jatrophihabitantaceae bacterium]
MNTEDSEQQRLQTACRFDLAIVVAALICLLVLRSTLVSSDWIDVLILSLVVLGICFLRASVLISRGRVQVGLVVFTVASGLAVLLVTGVAPFSLEISPVAILIPALLAVPHVSRAGIQAMFGATVAAMVALIGLGRFQPGAGLEPITPRWFLDGIALIFLPACVGLAGYVSWKNHQALVGRVEALRVSRARLVASTDAERRRFERDLHDGAQQHLVAAAMQLRVIQRLAADPSRPVEDLVAHVADGLQQSIGELRNFAHGIYPPQLTELGLEAALRAAAMECPLPVAVHARAVDRYAAEVETNAYFACLEAMQNAAKHAGSDASITIDLDGRQGLTIDISDTGAGNRAEILHAGHGITNMTDRLGAVGGTLTVDTGPNTGVHLHAHIPITK